jgi:hypothetical protein
MESKQITWTQSGHAIIVEVTAKGFTAFVDGKKQSGSQIVPPPRAQKNLYDARDAVGNIGNLVIYRLRAKELEAIRAELEAAEPNNPMDEFYRLESNLNDAREAVLAHRENPAIAYRAEASAQAALNAWCEANRELYEAEVTRRKAAERARIDSIHVDMWM